MKKYRFLQHTGDAKFRAYGKSLEESFTNAALATASLMWEWKDVKKNIQHKVKVEGNDLEQLLVNFLEEILYLLDSKMFLLASVEKMNIQKKNGRYFLNALFRGDKYSEKYKIFGDVKAITYHQMNIKKNDHFTAQVVVDI
ncbi:MAG: archease [Candidatus Aminicenantes bacterium]